MAFIEGAPSPFGFSCEGFLGRVSASYFSSSWGEVEAEDEELAFSFASTLFVISVSMDVFMDSKNFFKTPMVTGSESSGGGVLVLSASSILVYLLFRR